MDNVNIRFLGDLQRLEVKPNDVFVLTCDSVISAEVEERIQRNWERIMPGTKMIVLNGGIKLGVVGSGE